MQPLQVVVGRYPHTEAFFAEPNLVSGLSEGVPFAPRSLQDEPGAFGRMANGAEFDVCEMPIVSYLVARDRGAPICAVPIFVTRGFDQRRLVRSIASDVKTPRDLEGKAVGVRYYGFTDGTWARVALERTFGVNLDSITWVTSTAETVKTAVLPANVRYRADADLVALAEVGELAALILNFGQRVDDKLLAPLFPDPVDIERSWFQRTGVYPIHHVLVARTARLRELPSLASDLVAVFASAKERFLSQLRTEGPSNENAAAIEATRAFMGADPMPYGIAENFEVLDMIVRAAFDQHLIVRRVDVEATFREA